MKALSLTLDEVFGRVNQALPPYRNAISLNQPSISFESQFYTNLGNETVTLLCTTEPPQCQSSS